MSQGAFEAVAFHREAGVLIVKMIDQRALPLNRLDFLARDWEAVAFAIREMVVRGAPAIGIAAAMGVALAALEPEPQTLDAVKAKVGRAIVALLATRPTAVNLSWALERCRDVVDAAPELETLRDRLEALARAIQSEDLEMCRAIGRNGAELLAPGSRVLTHCNAGALATGGWGTALGIVRSGHALGRVSEVFADETRPLLQGARLTAWELSEDGIPVTVITDSMAAYLMKLGRVDVVIVGADRVAANGDAANKIGTYGLALAARAHGIPFIVAAPSSTVDLRTPNGDAIVIEERAAEEVSHFGGARVVPPGAAVFNPAFDVTPAGLITALVTERGVLRPVEAHGLHKMMSHG
ncbi:MAG: S-methyl-5-thioribose-1-phosphate isomerase [Myxococcales bacterium]|nr:S-methyl-5-thioribose-1-phosphate isomerase [Myxococcales bacterium]